jgi:hypothetical protein
MKCEEFSSRDYLEDLLLEGTLRRKPPVSEELILLYESMNLTEEDLIREIEMFSGLHAGMRVAESYMHLGNCEYNSEDSVDYMREKICSGSYTSEDLVVMGEAIRHIRDEFGLDGEAQ